VIGVLFDLDQTLIDSSIAEVHRAARAWSRVYPLIPQMAVYDGVAVMLAMLMEREVPIAVVTASPGTYCTRVIDHHGFVFAKKVCYHDTAHHKPHPAPILKGIELLGLPASDVWSIGDQPKDIQAAKAAGSPCIGVTWGSADQDALAAASPDRLIHTVLELHDFLDGLTS